MQRNARPGTPAFFWQAVLILLPVVVLAVACWWSLQQDERIAEDDARKQAAENANSLAQTLRNSLNGEWLRYFELQQQWMAGMRGRLPASQGSSPGTFPDARLQGDRQRWERDYPGLRLADVALPAGIMLTNGQVIVPPDFPVAPRPPPWFRELPKTNEPVGGIAGRAGPAKTRIVAAGFPGCCPSSDAKAAAGMLVLPLDQWIGPEAWAVPTETGITFGEIASYQLLTATNAALTEWLLQSLQRCAVQHPSMMSSKLLELAERLTNNASPELRQEYAGLRIYAGRASMAREYLCAFRSLPELAPWKTNGWPRWTPDQTALAVFQPLTRENLAGNGLDPLPQGGAYQVLLMPRPVVAALVRRVVEENRWLVPSYAAAEVVMEGVRVYDGGAGPAQEPWPFLAGAENETGPAQAPNAIRFQVNFGLASRPRLLAAAHRRAWIFGTLVLGAVLAALAGLLAARRAFQRQLQLNEQKTNLFPACRTNCARPSPRCG